MTKKNTVVKKDNKKNEVVEISFSEKQENVLKAYNNCILNEESENEATSFSTLVSLLKDYKDRLSTFTNNTKISINKAKYNTINFCENEVVEMTISEKVENLKSLFNTAKEMTSRRHVILTCLATEKLTEAEILEAINVYAKTSYLNSNNILLKANKKAISGSINDVRNNKALDYIKNVENVYVLRK